MITNVCFFVGNSPIPAQAAQAAERAYVEADSLDEAQSAAEKIKAKLGWSGAIRQAKNGKGVVVYKASQSDATQVLRLLGIEVE